MSFNMIYKILFSKDIISKSIIFYLELYLQIFYSINKHSQIISQNNGKKKKKLIVELCDY